jgi:DNA (cytosine-5)-methyltransferase 1
MGNALVTQLIEKMGKTIKAIDEQETQDFAQISLVI